MGRGFSGREDSTNDGGVHLVFALGDVAGIVAHAEDENGKGAFFAKILSRNGNGEDSIQAALVVSGFVAVSADVPGENAHLIEVVRQAIVRLAQEAQILWDLLVSVLDFVEDEKGDKALAFGVLGDVEGGVDVEHAGENPSDAALVVAHQPPVLKGRASGNLLSRLDGDWFGHGGCD